MSKDISFDHVKISGFSSVVGNDEICIDDELCYYENQEQLNRLKKTIGFNKRRVVKGNITTADMCVQATNLLLDKMNLSPQDFDAVVSVTQTPDYYMPGNAHVVHKALHFSQNCIAFDLEFGCSGFIYGLFFSYTLVNSGFQRVLLLTGDTLSKIINIKNRADAPIFGDAGCATVIERTSEKTPSHFVLYSDGTGLETMWKQAGAYRLPSNDETRKERTDDNGNVSSLENFYMNGFDVFNFTMTEQPKCLKHILEYSQKNIQDIDFYVMHQANRYIIQTITKKAKIPLEKTPFKAFEDFGNQSSASIPTTVCYELAEKCANSKKQVVFQGFGIGLSWGACQLELNNPAILKPVVYGG